MDTLTMLNDIAERLLRIEVRISNMESWMKEQEDKKMAADVLTKEDLRAALARAQTQYSQVAGAHPEAERRRDELRKRIRLLTIRLERAENDLENDRK